MFPVGTRPLCMSDASRVLIGLHPTGIMLPLWHHKRLRRELFYDAQNPGRKLTELLTLLNETLDTRLFRLGGSDFTLGSLLAGLIALMALLVLARALRRWMSQRCSRGAISMRTRARRYRR